MSQTLREETDPSQKQSEWSGITSQRMKVREMELLTAVTEWCRLLFTDVTVL